MSQGPGIERTGQEGPRDRSKDLGGLLDGQVLRKNNGPWKDKVGTC